MLAAALAKDRFVAKRVADRRAFPSSSPATLT